MELRVAVKRAGHEVMPVQLCHRRRAICAVDANALPKKTKATIEIAKLGIAAHAHIIVGKRRPCEFEEKAADQDRLSDLSSSFAFTIH